MDRVIFTAANGASRTLESQAVVSNNLANASTTGFRAQLAMYRSVPVVGEGLPTRVSTAMTTPRSDLSTGPLEVTGRPWDVAIAGSGWLAVETVPGEEGYTRDGRLQVDAQGTLRTLTGRAVLSDAGQPIQVPPAAQILVGEDGTLSALGAGDTPDQLQLIGRLKLANPDPTGLFRGDDGLFRWYNAEGAQAAAPQDNTVRVISGALEGSNVSAAESMLHLINNGRRFEMQMQVIQQANGNAERANQLLSPAG